MPWDGCDADVDELTAHDTAVELDVACATDIGASLLKK